MSENSEREVHDNRDSKLPLLLAWSNVMPMLEKRFEEVNLISPRSAFTITSTSCRSSILVKSMRCYDTPCTPSTMLNCKHTVSLSHCCHGALFNRVLSGPIRSIQNRICSLQSPDCSVAGVPVAADSFVPWGKHHTRYYPLIIYGRFR